MECSRRQFKGLRIYAIDGQQLTLPRTADIVNQGFHGRAVSHYRESYLPKAYFTHCYDLLSSITKDFRFSHRLNEHRDAREMVPGLEENSLTIYDRLYWSAGLVQAHFNANNSFLIRARRAGMPKEISAFFSKRKKFSSFQYKGRTLYLIKLRNKETQRYDVFVTNLPRAFISFEKLQKLYRLRWEVETSFRDLTSTLNMEEWHSKSLNGILQELYTALWLVNFTRSQMNFIEKKPQNPLAAKYKRANFKLAITYVARELWRFLQKIKWVYDRLHELLIKSTERRVHLSRAYPRQIRSPASPYKYNNTVWVDLA